MGKVLEKQAYTLYKRDFYAWLNDQAAKLRARSHNDIDWDNLAEEVESVATRQKMEIDERLERLIHYLLKWQFQPGRQSESWRTVIGEQRTFLGGLIDLNPSLKGYPADIFQEAFSEGRRLAIDDTGMQAAMFPSEPPFTLEQALTYRFLPGESFEQWMIIRD